MIRIRISGSTVIIILLLIILFIIYKNAHPIKQFLFELIDHIKGSKRKQDEKPPWEE